MIQLVGDQTVQNLLPVMALRPSKIIQIRSKDKPASNRFKTAAQNFRIAVEELSHEPGFNNYRPIVEDIELISVSPKISDVQEVVASKLNSESAAGVNFTGATKLMSIGAHRAAAALQIPSLYCDTQEKRFVDGATFKTSITYPSFEDTAESLSVPLLMAAHGKRFADWQADIPSPELLEYGRICYKSRCDHWDECGQFFDSLKTFFFREKGGVPKKGQQLAAILADALPVPARLPQSLRAVIDSALTAEIICRRNDFYYVNAQTNYLEVSNVANLLIGTWLELAILDMLATHPHLKKPLWSVRPGNGVQADFGEMDIVCVDQRSASLRYISCKSFMSGQVLEHLEAVGDRAHRMGGSFAGATLAVFTSFGAQGDVIRNYAKRLRIHPAVGPTQITHEFFQP